MLDLDHFKVINDTHGHAAGDRVLKSVADLLRRSLRKTDIIGRVGGEEFAVILPGVRNADAARLLDHARVAFSGVRQRAEGCQFTATFSCGIAERRITDGAEDLYAQADHALYQAKQTGRNRVVHA